MARRQDAKLSFSAGVLSPRLSLRADVDSYSTGLRSSTNFIISPQGGIVMREGFENITPTSVLTEPNRIFQFHKGGETSDMLVEVSAGDGLIHFYIDGVELSDTVVHDYTLAELEELYFTNQEKMAVICHAAHPPLYIEIALDGTITGEYLPSNLVPLADYKDENSPTAKTTGDAEYSTDWLNGTDGTTWNPSRNWILSYDGVYAVGNQGNPKEWEFSSVALTLGPRVKEALSSIPALRGTDTTIAVAPGAAGTDFPNKIDITITGAGGGKKLVIRPPLRNSSNKYVEVVASVDENAVLEPVWSYPTYVLHGGIYYQCIKVHQPIAVTNEPPNATYWTALAAKPDTFDWQYPDGNAWSDTEVNYVQGDRGFPTVCVIHQQRLILMANPGFTMGIFGSRINDYRDFTQGPEDDDPFFFAVDTSDTPTIKWAESQRSLIIGTSSGDYRLTAQVTLSPSDVQALKQNNARSNASKAVTVNTDVLYIEQGKEKIRSTGYLDTVESQNSRDISLIAEHLFDARVKRLALMQTPEVLIFALREKNVAAGYPTGSLVCLSYSPESQQVAWFEFVSQGDIVDIATAYTTTTDEDELWATITYDGGFTYYIQKMPYPKRVFTSVKSEDDFIVNGGFGYLVEQNLVCLDGWLTGTMIAASNNVITGLEQYEGLTVGAIVNDAWAGEYTVVDGAIILDDPPDSDIENYSGTWAVGFTYTATAETFEMAASNRGGIALGTIRRWNKLYTKTLNSALPKVNGKLASDRNPVTLMGIAEIIQVGLKDNTQHNLGWGDGSILIEQDRPYPTQILGLFGEFNSENA